MPVGYAPLETTRLTAIIQALQDVRQISPKRLPFLSRTPVVNATDAEIIARYVAYNPVADIVADDERAVVYTTGKLSFESVAIPNIKRGTPMRQETLNMLQSIGANGGIGGGGDLITAWRTRELANLLDAVRQREETMIAGMLQDSFSYSRFGINLANISWGMPSDLKVTTGVTWDTPATADGIVDILTVKRLANVRYGENYNRVTMSTAAFIYLIGQTAVQNKLRFVLPPSVTAANLPLQNTDYMANLISNYLNMTVELYDARVWTQNTDGTSTSAPILPITKVLLSDTADDNDPMVMNVGNAVVTESIVADFVDTPAIGSFGGPQFGPVSYTTPASPDLNPPGLTMWGVARAFPRKYRLQANAVLTVGAFADPIPFSVPF
jgi:hypothetical protein